MLEVNQLNAEKVLLKFRKSKELIGQVTVRSHEVPTIVQAIRSSYSAITYGYQDNLRCRMEFYDISQLLPLTIENGKLLRFSNGKHKFNYTKF